MDSFVHNLRRDLDSYTAIDTSLVHEGPFGADMADFFSCDIYNSLDISSATDAKYDSSSCLEGRSNASSFLSDDPNIRDWPVQSKPPNDEIGRARGGLFHKKRMLNNCGTFSTIITPQPKENKKQKLCKRSEEIRKAKLEDAAMGVVHVRARRGQATDSHSIAERVRRKRLSERMKILQALVPGCDKIKGKQQVLEEIIKYVQSLQKQIEFLSMKLVSVSNWLHLYDINLDEYSINQQYQHIVDEKEIMKSQQHPPSLPMSLWETDALLPSTSGIQHRVTNNYQMMEDPALLSSLLTNQGQYCSMSQD